LDAGALPKARGFLAFDCPNASFPNSAGRLLIAHPWRASSTIDGAPDRPTVAKLVEGAIDVNPHSSCVVVANRSGPTRDLEASSSTCSLGPRATRPLCPATRSRQPPAPPRAPRFPVSSFPFAGTGYPKSVGHRKLRRFKDALTLRGTSTRSIWFRGAPQSASRR
jgi:hypothetical protein